VPTSNPKPPPTNLPASVRDRLFKLSVTNGEEFQLVLTRFGVERLLYRLMQTPYGEGFVLKGAVLFTLWQGAPHRPTRDVDLLGRGDNSPASLASVFRDACAAAVEPDGLVFDSASVVAVANREDLRYPGVRVTLMARLGTARISLQVDIGFGDAITPDPMLETLPTLLPFPAVRMAVYPVETVVAEKLEAMVSRGMTNTRLKDYYDVWTLARTRAFTGDSLAAAMRATFARRQTDLPGETPLALSAAFATLRRSEWRTYLMRNGLKDAPAELEVVLDAIVQFLGPIIIAARGPRAWTKRWYPETGWR
jgi:Nucleotidyl transferase AbiEii toxin, Type IV TA system